MLLTDSFLDYLLHERNYSKGTVEYYRADILELQRFGEEMLGDLTPLDVDAELVREWIASLMDKGLASNTINRKLSSVRTYYKFLLRRGKVAVDPLRKVTGPKHVICKNKELNECDTMKYIKQPDGISYDVYNLEMVIAIAFRICSRESILFRRFVINEIYATKKENSITLFVSCGRGSNLWYS